MRDLQFHGAGVYGAFGPFGIVLPFTKEADMVNAALSQANKALVLTPLSDYRKAGDANLFLGGAGSRSDAHFHAAYWMAVSARLLQDKSLAALANQKATWASIQSKLPGSTLAFRGDPEDIREILTYAATTIRSEARQNNKLDDPNIRAILAVLGHKATGGATVQHQAKREQSPAGQVALTLTEQTPRAKMPPWLIAVLVGGGVLVVAGLLFSATAPARAAARVRRAL